MSKNNFWAEFDNSLENKQVTNNFWAEFDNPQETAGTNEPSIGQRIASGAKAVAAGVAGAIPDTLSLAYNLPAMAQNAQVAAGNYQANPYAFDFAPAEEITTPVPLIPSATEAIDQGIDTVTGGYTTTPEDQKYINEGIKTGASFLTGGGLAKTAQGGLTKLGNIIGNTSPLQAAGAAVMGGTTSYLSDQGASTSEAISGGLEVIDIDTKYETYDLWAAIKEKIPADIFNRLHIVSTRSGGKHLYYKCEEIEGNQKLAQRPPTKDEATATPHVKSYCIIETRGEAGYVVAPPSDGYKIIQKGINVISVEDRTTLFEIMRSFNEIIEEQVVEAFHRPTTKDYGVSPFDDYNSRGDIGDVLANHGWSKVKETSERAFYLRPGSKAEHSGTYNKSMGLFSVFSVNTPFVVQKGYKPSTVYAILEHNGDFKAAAKALLDLGYGEKKTSYGDKLERTLFAKKQNGASNDDLVHLLVQTQKKSITDATEIVNELEQRWGKEICTFWDIDKKGLPVINRYKLQVFLTQVGGFRLYFYDPNSTIYRLVRIQDGFVEESSTEQIKRFIKEYVDKLPDSFDGGVTPQDLLELIYKGASALFSEAFFEFFDRANIDFLEDTQDTAYFPFKNGVAMIKKDSVSLKNQLPSVPCYLIYELKK